MSRAWPLGRRDSCAGSRRRVCGRDGTVPRLGDRCPRRHATVTALKVRAAGAGVTLTAYLRAELDRLAARPSHAEVIDRLAHRDRRGGPSVSDTVAAIRRVRATS